VFVSALVQDSISAARPWQVLQIGGLLEGGQPFCVADYSGFCGIVMLVTVRNTSFWVVTPCCLVEIHGFFFGNVKFVPHCTAVQPRRLYSAV